MALLMLPGFDGLRVRAPRPSLQACASPSSVPLTPPPSAFFPPVWQPASPVAAVATAGVAMPCHPGVEEALSSDRLVTEVTWGSSCPTPSACNSPASVVACRMAPSRLASGNRGHAGGMSATPKMSNCAELPGTLVEEPARPDVAMVDADHARPVLPTAGVVTPQRSAPAPRVPAVSQAADALAVVADGFEEPAGAAALRMLLFDWRGTPASYPALLSPRSEPLTEHATLHPDTPVRCTTPQPHPPAPAPSAQRGRALSPAATAPPCFLDDSPPAAPHHRTLSGFTTGASPQRFFPVASPVRRGLDMLEHAATGQPLPVHMLSPPREGGEGAGTEAPYGMSTPAGPALGPLAPWGMDTLLGAGNMAGDDCGEPPSLSQLPDCPFGPAAVGACAAGVNSAPNLQRTMETLLSALAAPPALSAAYLAPATPVFDGFNTRPMDTHGSERKAGVAHGQPTGNNTPHV